jgi:tetratricopeptide (TPR) repeat protein
MEDKLSARRALSIRLSERLAEKLEGLSEARGLSMNTVISDLIAEASGSPELAPSTTPNDIAPDIARDACRLGPDSVGALKGIAKHLLNLNLPRLSAVVYTAAARVIADDPDVDRGGKERASSELTATARVVEAARNYEMAIALLREATALDSKNRVAENLLGQWLVRSAQRDDDIEKYKEAMSLLVKLIDYDSHAELFYGIAALAIADINNDKTSRTSALENIARSLRRWAFGSKDNQERRKWIHQVRHLQERKANHLVQDLVDFANSNAGWDPISMKDITG